MQRQTRHSLLTHAVQLLYRLAGQYCLSRFEARTRQASQINQDTLKEIVRQNAQTEFGKRFNLPLLESSGDITEAYRAAVQLNDYEFYTEYVDRIKSGEPRVLTEDEVDLLAGSAGTSHIGKRLPKTKRARKKLMFFTPLVLNGLLATQIPGAKRVGLGVNLMSMYQPSPRPGDSVAVMTSNNAGIKRAKRYIEHLWCSPPDVFNVPDQPTAHYLHALFALRDAKTQYIWAIFASQVSWWFEILKEYEPQLLQDISKGTLREGLALDDEQRSRIEAHLSPDPHRAAQLAAEFSKGYSGIIPRIWPRMSYIASITTGNFSIYRDQLDWLCDGRVPIVSPCHAASESMIGINMNLAEDEYVLTLGAAYYEFIRLAELEKDQPRTVSIADLEVGESYEVVLTTYSGLYRYRLGDIVEITGFHNSAPRFRYMYRNGVAINLAGEKSNESHITSAVESAVAALFPGEAPAFEYVMTGVFAGAKPHYICYIEFVSGSSLAEDRFDDFAYELDKGLCKANQYYERNAREQDRFGALQVTSLRSGTFAALRRQLAMLGDSVDAAQTKIPRLVVDSRILKILNEASQGVGTGRSSRRNRARGKCAA